MDLHFTDAVATDEERTAVDRILGPAQDSWSGGDRDERSCRQSEGGISARSRRHLLLPVFHAIQGDIGWISPGALNYTCARLTVPPAEAYGVATFYSLLSTDPQPATIIHVCDDIACKTSGADALCDLLTQAFGPSGATSAGADVSWKRSPCLGLCERAPAALFQCAGPGRRDFAVAPTCAEQLLNALNGVPESSDSARLSASGSAPPGAAAQVPQAGSKSLVLLTRVGVCDPESLDDYRRAGGYQALRRALELGPEGVIRELSDANLTGRGGAAFATHIKWKAVSQAPARPHYVVCNADESEPGTFKDRILMEQDPFAVIEGMTIAGLVCGAELGYIYIRGEYPEATARIENAILQARTRGLLGADIQGHGVTFDIEIRRGAGAYICGEETALLESIEGKRGEPRNKPPFPAQVGLFGKPTAVNNVETLVNLLPIISRGGREFAATGTELSTGPRLFCLSGCVAAPGVYELPYGETLRELLQLAGGVRGGRPLQAILLGGAAGLFVAPDQLDMPLTLEGARSAGATLGSGVVMVFDDTVDLGPILARIAEFFRDESCGQCVPCRVGTVRVEEALHRLLAHSGESAKHIALLDDLELAMKDASICGLGHTAVCAITSAIHRIGVFGGGPRSNGPAGPTGSPAPISGNPAPEPGPQSGAGPLAPRGGAL